MAMNHAQNTHQQARHIGMRSQPFPVVQTYDGACKSSNGHHAFNTNVDGYRCAL